MVRIRAPFRHESEEQDVMDQNTEEQQQRVHDLYMVNTVAGWCKDQLRILGDMAEDKELPDWFVAEVRRIHRRIETVAQREDARARGDAGA
jgi:hypothetical protein